MKAVKYSQRRLGKWDALSLDVLVPARHEGREGLDVVLLDLVAVHPTQTEPGRTDSASSLAHDVWSWLILGTYRMKAGGVATSNRLAVTAPAPPLSTRATLRRPL